MERFVKGDVVVIPFPFSDLSASKKRPALVLAALEFDDYLLCQITSKAKSDRYSVKLEQKDFKEGSLKVNSFIRTGRLFTAYKSLILYKKGSLKEQKLVEVIDKLINILKTDK